MLPFMRLVQEILANDEQIGQNDWCIQSSALMVLQMVAEAFMASHFEDAGLCVIHAKCVTVMPKYTHLALPNQKDKVIGHNIESSSQLSGTKNHAGDKE